MLKIFRHLFCLLILTLLGCGGGGGGSDENPAALAIYGAWTGDLKLVQDGCLLKVDPLSEQHGVSVVDGDQVLLTSTDGRVLEGTLISDNSFEVSISTDDAFPMIDTITYINIANGEADVTIYHSWSRPGGCTTIWQGKMQRFIHLTPTLQ